jgi:hypothetical protein
MAIVCTVLDVDDPPEWAVEYVAVALVDERVKAQAPFLALADQLEEPVFRPAILLPDRDMGRHEGEDAERLRVAARLRAVLEGDA